MNLCKCLEGLFIHDVRENNFLKILLVSLSIPVLFACKSDEPEATGPANTTETAANQAQSDARQILDNAQAELNVATAQAQARIDEAVDDAQERTEAIVEEAEESVEQAQTRVRSEVDSIRNRLQN